MGLIVVDMSCCSKSKFLGNLIKRRLKRFLVSMLTISFLTGCSTQYTQQFVHQATKVVNPKGHYSLQSKRAIRLPIDAKIFVATAKHNPSVNFDSVNYTEDEALEVENRFKSSSYRLSSELGQQLALTIPFVYVGAYPVTIESALDHARSMNYDFLLYPRIVIQSEKISSANEFFDNHKNLPWSQFGLDRIHIQVSIWDVNSKQFIDSSTIRGRSFPIRFSENNSKDLLASAMKNYANQLLVHY